MDYAQAVRAFEQGEFAAFEAMVRQRLDAAPESPRFLHDLGLALMAQGRFGEAREVFERFYRQEPGNATGAVQLGKLRLATGDFAGGWPLYDARLRLTSYNTEVPPYPGWTGEPPAGRTIVVWREQGFGDMIMGLRFLPTLRELGAHVTAVTRPALVRLYQSLGVEAVAHGGPVGELAELPAPPDFHTHPFSIPRWLGVTAQSIPSAPYLTAQARRTGGRLGVVWRGRPAHQYDRFRSLPQALGARLLALPGAISLEPEATGARDFQDTAEIVAGLDLVITVDTSVAHLAGALGRPVWILLPAHGLDWRWMNDRPDTPWYPTARLFRQPTPGDWASVVDAVLNSSLP